MNIKSGLDIKIYDISHSFSNGVNGSMMFLVFFSWRLKVIVVPCSPFIGSDVFLSVLRMELET